MEEPKKDEPLKIEAEEHEKKKRFSTLRAALICFASMSVLTGIIYPVTVTVISQAVFPYQSNGSQITVTLKDGSKKTYGSELIGQSYENPIHLFGRVNLGSPSNLSPTSDEYKALLAKRVQERKEKLSKIGYKESGIPLELLTSSGSGVDPHISPETAYFQVPVIVKARNQASGYMDDSQSNLTQENVKAIIDNYTEGRFLGLFGEKRVNVLLVNLSLDGEL